MIENYTFLRNESQFLKFLYFRQVAVSAKCLFGEKSVRHTVRSTKCSFDKVSVGKMSVRQSVFRQSVFGKLSGYHIFKVHSACVDDRIGKGIGKEDISQYTKREIVHVYGIRGLYFLELDFWRKQPYMCLWQNFI